ncbi:MAG: hypothetical protein JXA82_04635 [Sedimentisphaerales bacterium]|nr:hypothetical protein [Sedimentisphaerales bacterium]
MSNILLVIDAGLRFVLWLLPGLILIVVILLAFSWVDRRRDHQNIVDKSNEHKDKDEPSNR